jgi:ferredoxin-like protein FixX
MELKNWVYACVARLTDNYEWNDQDINMVERGCIEQTLIDAVCANEKLATKFVDICHEHGIVESDYFDNLEGV